MFHGSGAGIVIGTLSAMKQLLDCFREGLWRGEVGRVCDPEVGGNDSRMYAKGRNSRGQWQDRSAFRSGLHPMGTSFEDLSLY